MSQSENTLSLVNVALLESKRFNAIRSKHRWLGSIRR
jgi:hypothetical protein